MSRAKAQHNDPTSTRNQKAQITDQKVLNGFKMVRRYAGWPAGRCDFGGSRVERRAFN